MYWSTDKIGILSHFSGAFEAFVGQDSDLVVECIGAPTRLESCPTSVAPNMVSLERVQAGLAAPVVDRAEAPGLVLEKLDQL